MKDNVVIEILDPDNNIEGVLDVGNAKNFSMSLTDSIADIKDISTRSGSFSTGFKVPSTQDNDNLLEHIYLSSQKNYKDWDGEKDCRIRVNGINIETGRLRIERIAREGRGGNSYSLKFFGNNMDWVLRMKEKTTQDLPYLDTTLSFDSTAVEDSWSNVGGSELPVYSLINRGQKNVLDEWNVLDVRPDYFAIDYLNNAFKAVGYNFESTFFNSIDKNRLYIPFFGKNFRDYERSIPNTAIVQLDSTVTNFDNTFSTAAGTYYQILNFNAITQSELEDQRLNYTSSSFTAHSASSGGGIRITNAASIVNYSDSPAPLKDPSNNFVSNEYIVPYDNRFRVEMPVIATLTEDQTKNFDTPQLSHYVRLKRGGVTIADYLMYGQGGGTETINVLSANRQERNYTRQVRSNWFNAQAGDVIEVGYRLVVNRLNNTGAVADNYYFKLQHKPTAITIEPIYVIDEGDTFNWSVVSDDKVSILDIVTDIGRLFNIYWRTNTNTRTVYAEPRDDFYNPISNAIDRTDRVDPSKQFTITYNSSFYKENQNFMYKEDSNDGFLKARNEEASTDWCSYEHNFPAKFKDGSTKVETKVISATYTIEDIYCGAGIPMITSRLWVDDEDLKNIFESEKLAPRLLFFRYGGQQDLDGNARDFNWRGEATNRTVIPYGLPFPVISEGVTLADVQGKLTFKEVEGQDGLWYDHYRITAAEIDEGKRLSLNIQTDLQDYNDLDFREVWYFDNRYPEIEGYWRLVKLAGYKPTSSNISVKHEFIQAKVLEGATPTPDPIDLVDSGLDSQYSYFRYVPPNTGNNSRNVLNSGRQGVNYGYDNDIQDAGNLAFGRGLTDTGENNLRLGVNNSDVSTDTFQLGAGTPDNPFSLIRVDREGNTIFNGEVLIKDGGLDNISDVEISGDYFVNDIVNIIYVDSSAGGGWSISLESSPEKNRKIKIIDATGNCQTNKVTIDGNGNKIIGKSTIKLDRNYEALVLLYNGTEWNLI